MKQPNPKVGMRRLTLGDAAIDISRELATEGCCRQVPEAMERQEASPAHETNTNAGKIQVVGLVGCGRIGSGILELCLKHKMAVRIVDDRPISRTRDNVLEALSRAQRRGWIEPRGDHHMGSAVTTINSWASLNDCDLIIEAVPEDEPMKRNIIRLVEDACQTTTPIVTVTSSIPVGQLARGMRAPERLAGLHVFNPVVRMKLAELVPSLLTSEATVEAVEKFAIETLEKEVILAPDSAGFVVNRLLIPYLFSAARMIEAKTISPEDLDRCMTGGCNHPLGPLALCDLIGLDVLVKVGDQLYAEYRDDAYSPPPLLRRLVDAGRLGRKASRGFFVYDAKA